MEFRTSVEIPKPPFLIEPCERMLFVGSCFADRMGARFAQERFPVCVNPFGVMYNPVSVLHTVEKLFAQRSSQSEAAEPSATFNVQCSSQSEAAEPSATFNVAVLTYGTNHVYVEKTTGEIVDNCQKRPQRLFEERELSVDECAEAMQQTIALLLRHNPAMKIILTVSPIRYRKYGYHGSQLSKATLLLAIKSPSLWRGVGGRLFYFPAYELLLDELRDYRFYEADMLHPSAQAVEYIWERLVASCFSEAAKHYLDEWRPVKEALGHKPFHPDSPDYQAFLQKAKEQEQALAARYAGFVTTENTKSK